MNNIYKYILISIAFTFLMENGYTQAESPLLLSIKGHNTQFSEDGNYIIYNANNQEIRKLHTQDFSDEMIAKSGSLFVLEGEYLKVKDQKQNLMVNYKTGHSQKLSLQNNAVSAWPSSDLRSILVSMNGNEKVIQPVGDQDYINVSLSPDHTKIIFRASGLGSFICDLYGNIIKEIKDAEFPSWVNKSKVIYAIIEDDGYEYKSSDIYIEEINSDEKTCITKHTDLIPLYPRINNTGDKVVFSTPNNDVYLMKL